MRPHAVVGYDAGRYLARKGVGVRVERRQVAKGPLLVVENGQQAAHAPDEEGVRTPIHMQDRVIGLLASVHVRPQQVVARAVGLAPKSLVRPENPKSVEAGNVRVGKGELMLTAETVDATVRVL